MKQSRIWGGVCLLLGCAVETNANRSVADAELPKLLAERVTATVKREATRLVHLSTEHETLITTPDHPFATPGSGWVSAGQLVPGDRIVSAKFGAVRVLSAHSKKLSHPVPVFNLTVNPSHAYLVGMGQVLVHNTKCKEKPPRENALTRHTRTLEELDRKIEALKAELESAEDKTEIQKRLDELNAERKKVHRAITKLKSKDRLRHGEHVPYAQQLLQRAEIEYEAAKKELEATRSALRELETQAPRPGAERGAAQTRKAELEKTIQAQETDYRAAQRIVIWERRVAEIELSRKTEGKRPELERERTELRGKLSEERDRKISRTRMRRKLADPEQRKAVLEAGRRSQAKKHRSAAYVADAERPRDALELMREELAALREQPASASRDQRIAELTDRVETLEKLALSYRTIHKVRGRLERARRNRGDRSNRGEDTKETDRSIAGLLQELAASNAERDKLRAHALLLGLKQVRRRRAPLGIDEVLWRELEREIAGGSTIDEARLAEFERDLAETLRGNSDLLDDAFFEEVRQDALRDGLNRESEDVNEALRTLDEELQRPPSPARVTEVQTSLDRLQSELAEERQEFEDLDSALGTEATALAERLEQPGSSRATQAIRARLEHIRAQRTRLRVDWQERAQARLDEARRQLRDLQSSDRFRDEVIEAELARQITLLEYELALPPFKT